MKALIFWISIIFCSHLIVAQDIQNYQALVYMIDSMKKEYSVKELINSPMIKQAYQYRKHYKVLTTEYQNKVIDNICDLYNQTEYLGLYSMASVLLDDYYYYSKEEVRKKIIDVWYDKRCYSSFTVTSLGNAGNYSEKAKQRLLDILAKKWTQEDISIWKIRSEQSLRQYYTNDYMQDVKKIMKETNRHGENIEKILLDSLVQDDVTRNMKTNINRPVSRNCIYMIGSLNDLRFVPGLESMLEEYKDHKEYPEIKKACTYALAKLGVQKYLDEIYASDDINYSYLGTKEAFLRWLDVNFDWKKSWWKYHSESSSYPRPMVIMDEIFMRIKNVPKELLIPYSYSFTFNTKQWDTYDPFKDEDNKEYIQKIYNLYHWIKNNPDKWELPPASDRF
jgi:hypothetical protein